MNGTKNDDSLASFFDFCKRETEAPSPVSEQSGGICFFLLSFVNKYKEKAVHHPSPSPMRV